MEPDQFSSLTQDEDGWGDGVYSHNVTLMVDGQTGHDIDEPDGDGVTEKSKIITLTCLKGASLV